MWITRKMWGLLNVRVGRLERQRCLSADEIAEALTTIKAQDWSLLSKYSRNSVEDGWTWEQQTKKYETMFLRLAEMRGL